MERDEEDATDKMEDEISKAEETMGAFVAIGKSEDNIVQIEMNGYHELKNIAINVDTKDIEKAELCQALTEAFNNAIEQVADELEDRISTIVSKYMDEIAKEEKK